MMFHVYPDGGFLKWWYPQIIHFNRVFHYFHHPFWGTTIFGNIQILPLQNWAEDPLRWFFSACSTSSTTLPTILVKVGFLWWKKPNSNNQTSAKTDIDSDVKEKFFDDLLTFWWLFVCFLFWRDKTPIHEVKFSILGGILLEPKYDFFFGRFFVDLKTQALKLLFVWWFAVLVVLFQQKGLDSSKLE